MICYEFKIPNRPPDYIENTKNFRFWFEEMIFYIDFRNIRPLKIIKNQLTYFDYSINEWMLFRSEDYNEIIQIAYKKWLISKILKDKLNE